MELNKLLIQPFTECIAIGWREDSERIFNFLVNFGLSTKDEPKSTGTINYITADKEDFISALTSYFIMHSVRNKARKSYPAARAEAESFFNSLEINYFLARSYRNDGIPDFRRILSGDSGECDPDDPFVSMLTSVIERGS